MEDIRGSKKIRLYTTSSGKAPLSNSSISYDESLMNRLKDHEQAVIYLNCALEEALKGDEESQKLFLMALKNVAQAQGGISVLAEKSQLGRESLYKTLSGKGNPKWTTLLSLISAMNIQLKFS